MLPWSIRRRFQITSRPLFHSGSRPRLVTVSMWLAGTTAEYSAVQQDGQQYWRNTMGAST